MTGFEPQTSDIGSDHSANWATTTSQSIIIIGAREPKGAQFKAIQSHQ